MPLFCNSRNSAAPNSISKLFPTNLGPQVKSMPAFLIFLIIDCEGFEIEILFGESFCCEKTNVKFSNTRRMKMSFFMKFVG